MTWFKPRTDLDTVEQIPFLQKVQEEKNDNHWVTGYAGSGKSLLLLHCLIDEKAVNPKSNIIIVLYTKALIDMIREGIPNEYRNTRVVTYYEFKGIHDEFDLILIDEVQDIPKDMLSLCYSKTTQNGRIIVAGDINQSIYDNGSSRDEINNSLQPEISTLNRIYRISRTIRDITADFCYDKVGYLASDVMDYNIEAQPQLVAAETIYEEYKYVWITSKSYAEVGYVPAILISNHVDIQKFIQAILEIEGKDIISDKVWARCNNNKNYSEVNEILIQNDLKVQYLGNGFGSFEAAHNDNLVTIMTYHSAKGLDFKAVFVPFLNQKYVIWRDNYERAKSLFFVALTRSREQLIISYYGEKHFFLSDSFVNQCEVKLAQDEINRIENPFNGDDDDEIIYF